MTTTATTATTATPWTPASVAADLATTASYLPESLADASHLSADDRAAVVQYVTIAAAACLRPDAAYDWYIEIDEDDIPSARASLASVVAGRDMSHPAGYRLDLRADEIIIRRYGDGRAIASIEECMWIRMYDLLAAEVA